MIPFSISNLPNDILFHILTFLGPIERFYLLSVSKSWNHLFSDPIFKKFCFRSLDLSPSFHKLKKGVLRPLLEKCNGVEYLKLENIFLATRPELPQLPPSIKALSLLNSAFRITNPSFDTMNLSELRLSCNELTYELVMLMRSNPWKLKTLHFDSMKFYAADYTSFFEKFGKQTLEKLYLPNCRNVDSVALSNVSNLREIDFSGVFSFSETNFIDLLSKCPGLTSINISYCAQLKDNTIDAIMRYCPQITHVTCKSLPYITNAFISRLLWTNQKQLETLILSECDLITEEAFSICLYSTEILLPVSNRFPVKLFLKTQHSPFPFFPYFQTLELDKCMITGRMIELLDSGAFSSLIHLSMVGCKLLHQNIPQGALFIGCPKLKTLKMSPLPFQSLNKFLSSFSTEQTHYVPPPLQTLIISAPNLSVFPVEVTSSGSSSSIADKGKGKTPLRSSPSFTNRPISASKKDEKGQENNVKINAKEKEKQKEKEKVSPLAQIKISDTPIASSSKENPRVVNTTEKTPQIQTPQIQTAQIQTAQIQTPQIQTPQIRTPQIRTPQIQTAQIRTPQIQTPQIPTAPPKMSVFDRLSATKVPPIKRERPQTAAPRMMLTKAQNTARTPQNTQRTLSRNQNQRPLTASSSSKLKRPVSAIVASPTKPSSLSKENENVNVNSPTPQSTENQIPALHQLFPHLVNLELNDFGFHSPAIFESLGKLSSLSHLSITKCANLTDELLLPILYSNKGLTHLNLSGCANLEGNSFLHPSHEKEISNIIYLDLSECKKLSKRSVVRIAKFCPLLQTVNLDGCVNVDDSIFSFANCPLQSFSLKNCRIPDALAEIFVRKCRGLKSLSLSLHDDFLSKDGFYQVVNKQQKYLCSGTIQGNLNFEVTYKKSGCHLEELSITKANKEPLNKIFWNFVRDSEVKGKTFVVENLNDVLMYSPKLRILSIPSLFLNQNWLNSMLPNLVGLRTLRVSRLSFAQVANVLRSCKLLNEFSFNYDPKSLKITAVLKLLEDLSITPLLSLLEFKPLLTQLPEGCNFKNRPRLKIPLSLRASLVKK